MPATSYETLEEDLESGETEIDPLHGSPAGKSSGPVGSRSIYALTRSEIVKGIANRFVHSQVYIALYLVMVALSVTTVIMGINRKSPHFSYYILEFIINTSMILEVAVRLIAFGRQFWRSPWNVFDLIITVFCIITVLIMVFASNGNASKGEEVFDTFLLIGRNILQFFRLALIMRQSGRSIFARPKPIDLSEARLAGYSLDIDISDGEPLIRHPRDVVFDAMDGDEELSAPARVPKPESMPRAVQAARERDDEDMWASLG